MSEISVTGTIFQIKFQTIQSSYFSLMLSYQLTSLKEQSENTCCVMKTLFVLPYPNVSFLSSSNINVIWIFHCHVLQLSGILCIIINPIGLLPVERLLDISINATISYKYPSSGNYALPFWRTAVVQKYLDFYLKIMRFLMVLWEI